MTDYVNLPADADRYLEALSRGNAFFMRGEFDEAIAAFTEAIQIDPQRSLAYCSRYAAYFAAGRHDEAHADIEKVEQLDADGG